MLPFIRLTFELFQYPLECRPVRAFTFLFSDNKITRPPPPPVCLPLLSSPHPSSSKQQLHKEAFKIWPGLVYFMSHLFFFFSFGTWAQRNWGGRICICPVRGEWLAGCLGEWVDAITGRWIQITHTHTLPTISCIRRLHRHKKTGTQSRKNANEERPRWSGKGQKWADWCPRWFSIGLLSHVSLASKEKCRPTLETSVKGLHHLPANRQKEDKPRRGGPKKSGSYLSSTSECHHPS